MYKMYQPFRYGLFTGIVEVWKDVVGFEEQYQVSSFGTVRSKDRTRLSKGGCIAPIKGRIRKPKIGKTGYQILSFCKDAIKTHPSVHRIVATAFIPNTEDKETVNHIDGVKINNNVYNLEWSTHTEQMEHAVKNDLLEVRGSPKFSPTFKKEVYDFFHSSDISITKTAEKFGISERTVGRIVKGQIERVVKIPEESVQEIIRLRESGRTLKSIAEQFNCGISQIHRITRGLSRNVQYERG